MKRAALPKISRIFVPLLILTLSNFISLPNANAAIFTETFGTSTCSIQTTGLVITQNGSNISSNSAVQGNAYLSTSYGTMFGMNGCNINIQQPLTSVLITFPVSSQPTRFTFYAGAVDASKIHSETLTYVDDTFETFTVKNTDPNAGETITVTGNGKLIKSFSLNAWLPGGDYWFLDNLRWDTSALPVTSLTINVSSQAGYKGIVNAVTVTSNNAGRVTVFSNGKRIPNCISLSISASRTCSWKPSNRGVVILKATFTPSDSTYNSTTVQTQVSISQRSTLR
jgi:hypothetical protein